MHAISLVVGTERGSRPCIALEHASAKSPWVPGVLKGAQKRAQGTPPTASQRQHAVYAVALFRSVVGP